MVVADCNPCNATSLAEHTAASILLGLAAKKSNFAYLPPPPVNCQVDFLYFPPFSLENFSAFLAETSKIEGVGLPILPESVGYASA